MMSQFQNLVVHFFIKLLRRVLRTGHRFLPLPLTICSGSNTGLAWYCRITGNHRRLDTLVISRSQSFFRVLCVCSFALNQWISSIFKFNWCSLQSKIRNFTYILWQVLSVVQGVSNLGLLSLVQRVLRNFSKTLSSLSDFRLRCLFINLSKHNFLNFFYQLRLLFILIVCYYEYKVWNNKENDNNYAYYNYHYLCKPSSFIIPQSNIFIHYN